MTEPTPNELSTKVSEDTHEDAFGIDLDLLTANLKLSYEERLLQHHAAYELLLELENARSELES